MQDPIKPGRVGWHELHGGDPEKSFAFYSGLFGWTKGEALHIGAMETYQIFSTKGQQSSSMMKKMDQEPRSRTGSSYYISVDAIDAARGVKSCRRAGDPWADGGSGGRLDHQWHRSAGVRCSRLLRPSDSAYRPTPRSSY